MLKILCDEKVCKEVLDELQIVYKIQEKVVVTGYECIHGKTGHFYFRATEDKKETEFLLLELSEEEVWELDKFQLNLGYRKQRIKIHGKQLEPSESDDCFVYEKRDRAFQESQYHNLENLKRYKGEKLQLDKCDVYLLIPGKFEKDFEVWKQIPEKKRDVFDIFKKHIDECVATEYNSDFSQSLSRKCVGEVTIEIEDKENKKVYYQDALVGIVRHNTGFCVVEIMVQNCAVGGNKLLNWYCGNMLQLIYENKKYSIEEFLGNLHIRAYGKKRSMVFSYGEVTEEELVNALANEEFPMGKIRGDLKDKIKCENIAQYDTAEVYVSEETMFEKCQMFNVFGNQRLKYDAIEIFFVELILFQDAAIEKVYVDLEKEREKQKENYDVEKSIARYEEINFDMSQAIRFADYSQFNFPTVRKSAQKVASCFGIEQVFEKYERNKALLESLISANKRKRQEEQDNIKNRFLFLLSTVAAVGTLGDIFFAICQETTDGLKSYIAAFVIIAAVFGVYKLSMFLFDSGKKGRKER